MTTFAGLTDPPQPSYAPSDLLLAVGERYWPPLVLVLGLYWLSRRFPSAAKFRVPPLYTRLPILVWAFQGSWLVHSYWGWLSGVYILWHDFFVAMLGLVAVLGSIQLCHLSGARAEGVRTGLIPGSVWTASIIGAAVLDLALMIFCSSPVEAVYKF